MITLTHILTLVVVAFATASISFTISWTMAFHWFRSMFDEESKLGELVHCPYCLGHYVAWVVLLSFEELRPAALGDWPVLFISWFAVMGLVIPIHFVALRAYAPVAEAVFRRQRERAKANT